MRHVLQMVRDFRALDARTPVVLMGYANPVERYGIERFVADAKSAGVDGVLVVDYPPEECEAFAALLQEAGLDPIFLLAPTSTEQRIRHVGRIARGYVYYVSLKGVTGAGHLDVASVAQMLPRIREHVKLPVGVGFGIRDGQTAKALAAVSDAVVIGSRLVRLLEEQPRDRLAAAGRDFIASIRGALDEQAVPAQGANT
jgi:tryptophan synthase alpha chain